MADQEVLPGAPDPGGIWRRYLTHGTIDHAAWLRARAESLPVGTCRHCAGQLHPEAPVDRPTGTDYEATCPDPRCGAVVLAPGGRIIHGTSAAWSHHNGPGRVAQIQRAAREGNP